MGKHVSGDIRQAAFERRLKSGAGNKSGCFGYIGGIYRSEKWRLPGGKVCIV